MNNDLMNKENQELEENIVVEQIKLKDLDFKDLYLSDNGEIIMHGSNDSEGPISSIPDEALNDLIAIRKQVLSTGQQKKTTDFYIDYDDIRYRIAKLESTTGITYVLRKHLSQIPRIKSLGFPAPILRYLAYLGKKPNKGLILFAGPTAQGKTTSACSLLQEYLLKFGDIAITIEDPPEMKLEGYHGNFGKCYQLVLEDSDFGTALIKSLRYSPRYIFLGEIRKPKDASQALRAAISGHLVITTIHGGSVEEALQSLLKLTAGEESLDFARTLLADGLACVIHQTLEDIKIENKIKKKLRLSYLFTGEDRNVRTMIREGNLHLLSTPLEQQKNLVIQGQMPVKLK